MWAPGLTQILYPPRKRDNSNLAFIDSTEPGSSRYQLTARQTAGRRLTTSVNQHTTLADWAQITYNTDRAVLRAIEPIYSEAEALSWNDGSLSLTFSPGQAPILTSTAALLWTVQREVPVEIEHPQEWAIYL